MALEVGIVGLPGAGKTTLFTALTKTGGAGFGKENVGMATIADERLGQLAALVGARKVTPATIRVVDVPGHRAGAARRPAPGRCRPRGRGRLHARRRSGGRPRDARARAARRRPRPRRAAARAGREAGEVRRRGAAEGARGADGAARAPRRGSHAAATSRASSRGELEPLTTKPLISIVNGPGGIDLQLEAELAELPEEEAAAYREGPSALDEIVRRLSDALGLITFFTAGDKETRAWTLRRGESALDAAATIHSDIARGFIRAETITCSDLLEAGSHAEAARRGHAAARGQDLRDPGRRRPEHPLQRLESIHHQLREPATSATNQASISRGGRRRRHGTETGETNETQAGRVGWRSHRGRRRNGRPRDAGHLATEPPLPGSGSDDRRHVWHRPAHRDEPRRSHRRSWWRRHHQWWRWSRRDLRGTRERCGQRRERHRPHLR